MRDRRWALIRLDGDMYESTIDALENLYPNSRAGGFIVIDDYEIESCRRAVDDYRAAHGIDEPIETIDWTGVYWRRSPVDAPADLAEATAQSLRRTVEQHARDRTAD